MRDCNRKWAAREIVALRVLLGESGRNISQNLFAKRLKVRKATVYGWEGGKMRPGAASKAKLNALAKENGIPWNVITRKTREIQKFIGENGLEAWELLRRLGRLG